MHRVPSVVRRHILTLAFIGGFVTDLILLNQVDDLFDNLILLTYVILATISLVVFYAALAGRFGEQWSTRVQAAAAALMQYSFGGLFSGMLIFYGRSSDPVASWPFLLLMVAMIAGNELLRERGKRLVFNLTAYFVGVFSYVVLVVPVFTGWIGPWVFLGSGVLALAAVYGVVQLLRQIIPRYLVLQIKYVVFSILAVFAGLQGLYVANMIPPIPLSLYELTIAHDVSRNPTDGRYTIRYESAPWWNVAAAWRPTIHIGNSRSVACFSSVFAPAKITTDIYHVWEFKDEATGIWSERFRVDYPISGAARNGYRGYSQTTNATAGTWRCSVKTGRGQVLGHQVFVIDTTTRTTDLTVRVE